MTVDWSVHSISRSIIQSVTTLQRAGLTLRKLSHVHQDVPHSPNHDVIVSPCKKEEKKPLPWGRLVSGAEVGVDLQSKEHEPETHEENWKNQLVPQRHA